MLNVEKIYIIHYTKLIERRLLLQSFFNKNNINPIFINQFDKESLSDKVINEYYSCDQQKYNSTINVLYKEKSVPFRKMNLSEISLAIKQYNAIKMIADDKAKYGLILEDDIIFKENFINNFNLYLQQTPKNWDAIFMGNCCDLKPENTSKDKLAYLKKHPATKCADSYLIKKEMAKKIINTMKPFNTVLDWELAYQFYIHSANVYWWEPSLTYQGSESGLFKSAVR